MPPFTLLRPVVPFVVALCAALVLVALRALWRWRSVPSGAWLVLDLHGPITEVPRAIPRWQRWIGRRAPLALSDIRRVLRVAANDPSLSGLLVRVREPELGWATAESLRDAIALVRAANKRTVAFLPFGGSNKELLLASACAEMYATPPATIGPLGVSIGSNFFRSALAKLGIHVEVLSRKEFKSAAESFARDSMSEANRAQTEALADALIESVQRALVQSRRMDAERARAFIDKTPVRARQAQELGVLDGAMYEDELLAKLREPSAPLPFARLVDFDRYTNARARPPRATFARKRVAIIEVRGPIAVDGGRSGQDRVADVAHVTAAIRACAQSKSVGAVVLLVDSPGGSALASDLIAREVERLRDKKPVVAYFGDVAASGGYYIAALAHRIVAQRTTITGSIGVVAMRVVVEKAAEKLGITHESVDRGARSNLYSPYRSWTEDERATLDQSIDEVYTDFVRIVAKGRSMSEQQVEERARGRVYPAQQALELGLIDEIGDLSTAIAAAAERGSIDPALPAIRVVRAPLDLPPIAASDAKSTLASALLPEATPWLALVRTIERETILLVDERVLGAKL
jgi:protease-4